MSLRLAVLKNVYEAYSTQAYPMIFFFFSMVYLIIKDKKEDRNLLLYEIFGILLLMTPFIGNKIITIGAGEESNWPVYGILCAVPLTAFVAVEMLSQVKSKKEKYAFMILFVIIMCLGLVL